MYGVTERSPTFTAVPAPDTFSAAQSVGSSSHSAGMPFFFPMVALTTAEPCVVSDVAPMMPPKNVGRLRVIVTAMRSHDVPSKLVFTDRNPSVIAWSLSATG